MADYSGAHTGAEVDDGVGVTKGAGTGIVAKTGTGAGSKRTITGTADEVSVTNGDGVSGDPTLGLAAAAKASLALADSATQPGDLATVATSGVYNDLTSLPTLGSAAAKDTGTSSGEIPVLDGSGKLLASVMPSLAISEFQGNFTDLTAALADAGVQASQRGDWFTTQEGGGRTYIIKSDSPTVAGDVSELSTPTDAVSSINGKTGNVTLDPDDLDDSATTNKFTTAAEISKLAAIEAGADVTDAGNVGAAIAGATAKSTPVDADTVGLIDSTASSALKKLSWSNIKAALKTYFDTLYASEADVETTTVNAQTGTAYTLQLTDRGQTVTMDNASANTVTIPTNASVAFGVGSVITVVQKGAGVTTIAGDAGVTVNGVSAGSGAINNQYQGVSLMKVATDTWIASGDIATVA